jgi:hypothetical protein
MKFIADGNISEIPRSCEYYDQKTGTYNFSLKFIPETTEYLKQAADPTFTKPKKCYKKKCNNDAAITFLLSYKMPEYGEMQAHYNTVSVCKDHLTKIVKQKKDGITLHFPSNTR